MDNELDKKLKDRIIKVFDEYSDPAAAEGWIKLREKFPEEKAKRRAVAWWWLGAAALLLLFLGFGLWEYEKYDNPVQLTNNTNHKDLKHQNLTDQQIAPKANSNIQATILKNQHKNNNSNIAQNTNIVKKDIDNLTPAHYNKYFKNKAVKYIPAIDTNKHQAAYIAKGIDTNNKNLPKQPVADLAANSKSNTNKQAVTSPVVTAQVNPPLVNNATVPGPVNQKKSIADMFAADKGPVKSEESYGGAKVRFGIYAATYFNYSKGSGNQANLGGGVTADITITKHLKLQTGITVAQNSLNFDGGVPTYTAQTSIAEPYALPASAVSSSAYHANAITLASVPSFKDYDANLVGLDVPLNLKYEFNPDKSDIYVLAGFSSGTFINETYTYQYNYPALLSPSLQDTKNETSRNSFDSFYFAKTLNFAFGVGYPLGKNRIVFEPFLKYPLQGLGTQDIKFGAGGINLKFNFSTAKK